MGVFGATYLVVKARDAAAPKNTPATAGKPSMAARVMNYVIPCNDGTDMVVLDSLPRDLSYSRDLKTEEEVECKRTELRELEVWASALPENAHDEVCIKKGYLGWIAFYKEEVSQSEYDIHHPSKDDSVAKYERSIKEYKASHEPVPLPPPVSCDQ